MAKKTTVDVDGLKSALSELNALQREMNNTGGAVAYTADLGPVNDGIGPLLENAGDTISKYVNARKDALTKVHGEVAQAVGTATTLLTSTITNYENNENAQRTAADGTDTSGGSDSGGSADQKG